ncbi:hypothetical protein KH5H1_28100 [Corallococcus caeni]|uniref:Uncharacterized protein n=1 Tax=Corallococcus caeni TaxID=3082388 RepID=A0ABQ6QR93_9BACT|nr:hypothetical protein KH5H1_28100 [Corallococcus sp. KH5-1]GMU06543.1 hypothetical protein ASNO1_27960 [Corallococcus sp. NO1]
MDEVASKVHLTDEQLRSPHAQEAGFTSELRARLTPLHGWRLGLQEVRGLRLPFVPEPERAVDARGGADEAQVAEGLGEVSQLLARHVPWASRPGREPPDALPTSRRPALPAA